MATRIKAVFRKRADVHGVYGLSVERARAPVFYADLGVPDTVDGRFEMIALHVHLVCRRLTAGGDTGASAAQDLFDHMFLDMDRNLREMGTGDLMVGKRIKRMAHDYYGRAGAVEEGLAGLPEDLTAALERNVYGGAAPGAAALAVYLRAAADWLAAMSPESVLTADSPAALYGPAPEAGT